MKSRVSKKQLAVDLYEQGLRVETIASLLHADPSYVANTLVVAGHTPAYADLYTTSAAAQNRYASILAGVLRFKDIAAARASIARIDAIYHEFEAKHDRRGQHQVQLLALTGKNRAEGIGKRAEAKLFADWLIEHLRVDEERESRGLSVATTPGAEVGEDQDLRLAA